MEKMSIMQSEFKPLDLEFRGRGQQKCFWFKCLNRVGDVALYEKRDTEDGGVWWEVIVVQKRRKENGRRAWINPNRGVVTLKSVEEI